MPIQKIQQIQKTMGSVVFRSDGRAALRGIVAAGVAETRPPLGASGRERGEGAGERDEERRGERRGESEEESAERDG